MKTIRIGTAAAGLVGLAAAAAAGVDFDAGRGLEVGKFLAEARLAAAPVPSAASYALAGRPGAGIDWVSLPGGTFLMGAVDARDDAKPVHPVALKPFAMSRTLVTVAQYRRCVDAGTCAAPDTVAECNWGKAGRENHPVNCLNWDAANAFARFAGARLPTESEWEYAAKGGLARKYPWGDEPPTCARVVMQDASGPGCGGGGTRPVCSRPAGNTPHGFCDMSGNVRQWTQDKYRETYDGAPTDGGAADGPGPIRVTRGGSFYTSDHASLRADFRGRGHGGAGFRYANIGFRLAR